MQQRVIDLAAAGHFYKRKFKGLDSCVYCGELSTQQDHVFPLVRAAQIDLNRPNVLKELLPHGLCLVPTCSECNGLAGSQPFVSILAKRAYIQARLRAKYQRELGLPMWTYEELEVLGYSLRMSTLKDVCKANSVYRRLMYPRMRRLLEFEQRLEALPQFSQEGPSEALGAIPTVEDSQEVVLPPPTAGQEASAAILAGPTRPFPPNEPRGLMPTTTRKQTYHPPRPCKYCHQMFAPKRPHGEYCKDKCRVAAWQAGGKQ